MCAASASEIRVDDIEPRAIAGLNYFPVRNPMPEWSDIGSVQEVAMARRSTRSEKIATLNDDLRCNPLDRRLGKVVMTSGVSALGTEFVTLALAKLAALTPKDFRTGNDPYRERDFESFMVGERKCFFKIDYFRRGSSFANGSDDPADSAKTERLMTIMLASEY